MKNGNLNPFRIAASFYCICTIALIIIIQSAGLYGQCISPPGSIIGTVYADANNDGILGSSESGISGVFVEAYDSSGNLLSNTTTEDDGSYELKTLVDGTAVRVQFSYNTKYYSSFLGTSNGSSIQYVQIPNCDIDFGLVSNLDFCNLETELITTCFVQGVTTQHPDEATIVGIKYGFDLLSTPRKLASQIQTGSIWGLGYKPSTKEIFSASFVKQYAGLTSAGHDAIFKTIASGSGFTTSLFTKLSLLGQVVGTLAVTDVADCAYGAQVGKIGLGALVVSPDEESIYTVNLYNNTLVKLSSSNPTPETTTSYDIPGIHAFALKFYNDKLYVGTTNAGKLIKVYEFNPNTGLFINVFETNLIRGVDWYDYPADGLSNMLWLTDLDFTDDGNMLLSLSDRIGHRYCEASTNRLDEQRPDLLMAWNNNGKWELEKNGSAGSLTGSGVDNGQGPNYGNGLGNGEFFGDDYWIKDPLYHSEIAIGSIFVLPGTNSVVAAVFDPDINAYSGGLHRYNTKTGRKEGAKELYVRDITNSFGKASGFGDLVATCGLGEIEIGNYVWLDINTNGIQDPSEHGMEGVILNLFDENCSLVGTTTTDDKGNYKFNNANVKGGLFRNRNYYLGIDNTQKDVATNSFKIVGVYFGLTKSTDDANLIDSDITKVATVCGGDMIQINVDNTNHTFDIGLVPAGDCSLKLTKRVVGDKSYKIIDDVIFELTLGNKGTTVINGANIIDRLPSGYEFLPDVNPQWQLNDGILSTTLNQKIGPGESATVLLSLQFSKTSTAREFTNYAEVTSIIDASNNTITAINTCFDIEDDAKSSAYPIICDLALIHRIDTERIYTPDSDVTFVTTVCNQGTVDAVGFDITNYLNEEFDFDPIANSNWTISSDLKYVTYTENKSLAPKECRNYYLTYTILDDVTVSQIVNFAEISTGSCQGVAADFDFDSTPDSEIDNDKGGVPNTTTDNYFYGDGEDDEDDIDPAVVQLDVIDLSLKKTIVSRRANAGDVIVFNLTIKNEGNVPVSRATLVDYVPVDTDLVDPSWELMQDGSAEKIITFSGNLQPGQSYVTQCSLKIHTNVRHPATIYNTAEIKDMFDQYNRDISNFDVDSTPDNIRNNDVNENTKDLTEDDISTAYVVLICPAEYEPCSNCRAATTPTNGQFELFLKIASQSDEGWYVESSAGLYRFDSALPPALPIPLPDGYLLDVLLHEHDGHSYYLLRAVHIDKAGFSVRFRNKYGDLEQVVAPPATCSFESIDLDGPRSLCTSSTATYTAESSIADATYVWYLDGVEIDGESEDILDFDWTGATIGLHEISVSTTKGCIAPAIINVAIGEPDNKEIACLGDFNISMDGDCEIQVTPAMVSASPLNSTSPYIVMLMDSHGNIIPNATITKEYVGTKITAKLIENCGGNSCWSTISVEDKTPPISICRDIILPCYKLDQYEGPFESDNCDGPVKNVIVSEVVTNLNCDANNVKYIDRVYQATDQYGNKSALCPMRITLQRPDLTQIDWPESFTLLDNTVLVCNSYAKDEFGGPAVSVTGVPTLAKLDLYPSFSHYCNLYTGYTDTEISNIGCIKKVMRNWIVYEEHCSTVTPISYTQTIEITDIVAPKITALDNITVSVVGQNICEAKVSILKPEVKDSCSNTVELDVTYPGGFINNQTKTESVSLPVGINLITYTAYDPCGNSSQMTTTITVKDITPPTVICKGTVVTSLNSNGEAYLYARNLDDGSYDGCGIDSMKVARMVPSGLIADSLFAATVSFGCEDVGESIMVSLRVWDMNGNSNSCMVSVIVQDKIAPVITCPAHLTIDCSEVFSGMDLNLYGMASAYDVCGATVTESAPTYKLNSCREGSIERKFVATDGTSSTSCTQIITVQNKNPFNPSRDITKSIDFEVTENCVLTELTPDKLTGLKGYPTINQTACSMASASYSDDVYSYVTGACFKIVRNWTVIDWCEMQRLGDSYVPFRYVQTISVNNIVPPYFVNDIKVRDTFYTAPGNCIDAAVSLSAVGGDACTPDNKLRWQYLLDEYNDGKDVIKNTSIGNTATFAGNLPLGTHKIQWSFEDACGNVTTKDQFIVINNSNGPKAACLESISVSINPMDTNGDGIEDMEMGCIIARTLNASSSHPCGTPFTYSFSADVNDTIKCFNCFDVALIQNVEFWVIDIYGNTDKCIVKVDVQDNNDSDLCDRICENNMPNVVITTSNSTPCSGVNTSITASGGTSYIWSNGATSATISVVPTSTSTYTVTVSNALGCTSSSSTTLNVLPRPSIAFTGNDICIGQSTTITASGGQNFVWSTGANTSSITVSPAVTTDYIVTVTGTNGCTSVSTKTVQVFPLPVLTVAGDKTVCQNLPVTLTASGANSYLWSNGAVTPSITVTPTSTSTYTVTGTNAIGCTSVLSTQIQVNPLPVVTITGQPNICEGESTTLIANGGGTYLWSTGATTSSISVNPSISTTYSVTATNANGCVAATSYAINVLPRPSITFTGDNICRGQTTTIVAAGGQSYLWSTGATTSSINVSPAVTTDYIVTATGTNGCTSVATKSIQVFDLPVLTISGDKIICQNLSTTLSVTGANSYVWSTGATTASITVTPASTSTYTVTGTNANGCTSVLNTEVIVNPLPTVVISGDANICLSESTTLSTTSGGTYLWSNGATTSSITISPTVNTQYSVTVTDVNGCIGSSAVNVTVDPGVLVCSTKDVTVYLDQDGQYTITPEEISTGSTGACTNIEANVNSDQFFCNDVSGPVVVTLTVTNTITNQTLSCTATVTVVDSIKPVLVCPPNVTVNCTDFNPNAPLTKYGVATASDNCPNNLRIDTLPIRNLNLCNVGEITRTFTATDNDGNSVQCVQLITIQDASPITLGNITFPPDISISHCNANIDPSIIGRPAVNNSSSSCNKLSINFVDNKPLTNPVCADEIIRTWTVIDTCQLLAGTSNGIFSKVQRISILSTPVTISGPSNSTIYKDVVTCMASLSGIAHTASGCNFTLSNNRNNNASFDVTGVYPSGVTNVVLTARDNCTNTTTNFNYNVTVLDTTTTRFICEKSHPQMMDTDPVRAEDFASDNVTISRACGDTRIYKLSYSNTDINDTIETYFCDQVFINIPITTYVWANGVVVDQCDILGGPFDDNGFCLGGRVVVDGSVVTENKEVVKDVEVNLSGSNLPANITNDAGKYAFSPMEKGGEYEVYPSKNINPLEGVSTLDLIYIQNHILGTKTLSSPYQMIAADINKDNKISTVDMLQLRKLILGIYSQFPSNTSWRMVDALYQFADPTDPFSTPISESYHISTLNSNMNINWIGVKTGDVNGSYVANLSNNTTSSRAGEFAFTINDETYQKGSMAIPVLASKDQDMVGFQLAFRIDNVSNLNVESGILDIQDYNYSYNNGYLVISYHTDRTINVREGDALFNIKLELISSVKPSSVLSLEKSLLKAEYYTTNLESQALDVSFVRSQNETFQVWGNTPNPWSQLTSINFFLPRDGDVTIKVQDITGRTIYTTKNYFPKGSNSFNLSADQLPAGGLLIYDLTFDHEVKTMKMLNIK